MEPKEPKEGTTPKTPPKNTPPWGKEIPTLSDPSPKNKESEGPLLNLGDQEVKGEKGG